MSEPILLVGGAGRLGNLIVGALREAGHRVRMLVRPGRDVPDGVERADGDLADARSVDAAVDGASAVISAVNGGPDIAVDGQLRLLDAAKRYGVRRFIPSDYSVDYFRLDPGDNVFLDYRKRVAAAVEDSGVDHTFVLIGGFMEVMVQRGGIDLANRRVAHWGTGDEPVDVTATPDVARVVAHAVLDPAMRNRRVEFAGDVVTARGIAADLRELTGGDVALQRMGSVDDLARWITEAKAKASSPLDYVFAQYAWAQVSGKGKLRAPMNAEFPEIRPTKMRDMLRASLETAR